MWVPGARIHGGLSSGSAPAGRAVIRAAPPASNAAPWLRKSLRCSRPFPATTSIVPSLSDLDAMATPFFGVLCEPSFRISTLPLIETNRWACPRLLPTGRRLVRDEDPDGFDFMNLAVRDLENVRCRQIVELFAGRPWYFQEGNQSAPFGKSTVTGGRA